MLSRLPSPIFSAPTHDLPLAGTGSAPLAPHPDPSTPTDDAATVDPGVRLILRGVVKRYPGLVANDHVDLTLRTGEIHALLGENGAGKSTLVKIIYGITKADAGEMIWEGQARVPKDPATARGMGIAMVFQHFSLFDSLTVTENIYLGIETSEGRTALAARIREISERYGLALNPDAVVHDLSVGERQRVEIIRALLQNPRLLIMDEPTSVLTPQEADSLFETLRVLRGEGRTVLYISHKLDEIRVLCDRATVLRGGKVTAEVDPKQETARSLARLMIGEEVEVVRSAGSAQVDPAHAQDRTPLLSLRHLSADMVTREGTDLRDVSLDVFPGEIVGIAGVAGNGQNTLMATLSGERLLDRPEAVLLNRHPVARMGPRARRNLGLAVVPEERLGRGAVPELSLAENALLSGRRDDGLVKSGMVKGHLLHGLAGRIIEAFGVAAGGSKAEARSLSGGNLQKFIIGREILRKPSVLVAGHPTWGVDAGAAAAIHRALLELRDQGAAILLISQDLEELFSLTDRIAVICAGHLSDAIPTHDVTLERIGLMMGGMFDTEGTGA